MSAPAETLTNGRVETNEVSLYEHETTIYPEIGGEEHEIECVVAITHADPGETCARRGHPDNWFPDVPPDFEAEIRDMDGWRRLDWEDGIEALPGDRWGDLVDEAVAAWESES